MKKFKKSHQMSLLFAKIIRFKEVYYQYFSTNNQIEKNQGNFKIEWKINVPILVINYNALQLYLSCSIILINTKFLILQSLRQLFLW